MKKLLVFIGAMFWGIAYADTETINWYKDGAIYNTTTCETGGDITLPAAPPKRGYNFTGWLVLLYDFSTLDASIVGNSSTGNATAQTWSTTFSYGIVSGRALCSKTRGVSQTAGTPDETGDGVYCWCKATGYKPAGSNWFLENASVSPWVYYYGDGSWSCASNCASVCGLRVGGDKSYENFRRRIFGITQ